jgi:hypothetical protein
VLPKYFLARVAFTTNTGEFPFISGYRFGFERRFRDFVGHGEYQSGGSSGYTRSGAGGFQNLLNKDDGRFRRRETKIRKIEAQSEEMLWLKPEIEAKNLAEAAKGQRRANQKNARERNFANNEELTQEIVARASARCARGTFSDGDTQITA